MPEPLVGDFARGLDELRELQRRTRAYVCHARETNLCTVLRSLRNRGLATPEELLAELRAVLREDQRNQGAGEPIQSALALLEEDPGLFLDRYFLTGPDERSKGYCSVTSR